VDLATGNLQRRVQTGGAVALIVVGHLGLESRALAAAAVRFSA
jgi:hypothetical protein